MKSLRWQRTTTMHIQVASNEIHIIKNFLHLNCAEYWCKNDEIHLKNYVLVALHTANL